MCEGVRFCVYSLITAPVTNQGESPLALAPREGSLDVIKYLVKECNASVSGKSSVVVGLAVATQILMYMKAAKLLMPRCTSKPHELLHTKHS